MNSEAILKELMDQKFALDQSTIVAATDQFGNINYVNEKFCQISGFSKTELIGANHRIINSGYHSREFFSELWQTISSGHVWKGEVCNKNKKGDLYWVDTTIVPFLDDHNKPFKYLSIRHEITQLKNAQKIIMEQQGKLIASSKLSALGEMAASIAHEINNPLGVILGRVEMLQNMLQNPKELDRDSVQKVADNIEKTARRIEKIVRSMRSFAHNAEDDPFHKVRVEQILNELNDLVSERFKNHSVEFIVQEIHPELSIECRSTQLLQILLNLLNNAHDAVYRLKEKWVRLSIETDSKWIIFRVTDSGSGIPEHIRQKLFSPFFSTKEAQYGTGLGLSISQSLAQKNNGSLELNEDSENTEFVLKLPLKQ